jgi:hypothetical protein
MYDTPASISQPTSTGYITCNQDSFFIFIPVFPSGKKDTFFKKKVLIILNISMFQKY